MVKTLSVIYGLFKDTLSAIFTSSVKVWGNLSRVIDINIHSTLGVLTWLIVFSVISGCIIFPYLSEKTQMIIFKKQTK